jgi:hypothetical protein
MPAPADEAKQDDVVDADFEEVATTTTTRSRPDARLPHRRTEAMATAGEQPHGRSFV